MYTLIYMYVYICICIDMQCVLTFKFLPILMLIYVDVLVMQCSAMPYNVGGYRYTRPHSLVIWMPPIWHIKCQLEMVGFEQ